MHHPLVMALAIGVSAILVAVAMRDLYLNYHGPDTQGVWRGLAHSRARAGALAGAVTAVLLLDISPPAAIGAWVFSVFFVLFPSNDWTTRPDGRDTKIRKGQARRARQAARSQQTEPANHQSTNHQPGGAES
jgi:hypothetical protein